MAANALNPSSEALFAPTKNLALISPTATAQATMMRMMTIHVLEKKRKERGLVSLTAFEQQQKQREGGGGENLHLAHRGVGNMFMNDL